MRRAPSLLLATLMTGALAAGPLAPSPAHAVGGPHDLAPAVAKASAGTKVKTPFALSTSGFGSRVSGGQVPASADDTAYQVIGCTRLAGTSKTNTQVTQVIPGIGVVRGAETFSSTTKKGRTVTSRSVHTIARVTLVDSPLGRLEIQGLRSESRAMNVRGTFKAVTDTDIGRILYTAPGGLTQTLPLPAPSRPLTVPGLATISVGTATKAASRTGASATANVLDVQVVPTRSRVVLAQTRAAINGNIRAGLFSGFAAGTVGRGLADNLKLGPTPNNPMPCTGTGGKLKRQDIARVELGDQASLRGLATSHQTTRTRSRSTGVSRGQAAEVSLAGDRVRIEGVVGQVTVSRSKRGLTRSTKGTTIGAITVDGTRRSLDQLGDLEIPGLIRLDRAVTTKLKSGLSVVGLRATLLDGSGAVIDIGVAGLQVRGIR